MSEPVTYHLYRVSAEAFGGSSLHLRGTDVQRRGYLVLTIYYELKGGHVHCRVFCDGALTGTLVFAEHEWLVIAPKLGRIAGIVPEDMCERGAVGSTVGSQPADAGSTPVVRSTSYRV